jgi:hypothetical protein
VYEPIMLLLADGATRPGSLLTLDEQIDARGSLAHERCLPHARCAAG